MHKVNLSGTNFVSKVMLKSGEISSRVRVSYTAIYVQHRIQHFKIKETCLLFVSVVRPSSKHKTNGVTHKYKANCRKDDHVFGWRVLYFCYDLGKVDLVGNHIEIARKY